MKSRFGRLNFSWLLASSEANTIPIDERLSTQRMEYPVPPKFGTAWVEALEVSEGFRLYRAVHQLEIAPFGEMVPLLEVQSSEPAPLFCAQTWLSGVCCHEEYWKGRNSPPIEIWGRPGLDTFRLIREWDARVLIVGGGVSEMRSITISQTQLQSLIDNELEIRLLKTLGLDETIISTTRSIPQRLNTPLLEAMSGRYIGPARRLFSQTKALEYLGGLVDFLLADGANLNQRRHRKKICELRDYLLSLDGKLPMLRELAENFGLSAKQLNIEFKTEFGQSIFDYVTSNRLEQAHDALLESDAPIKVLAERLGYSHSNHFITAFKRRFGYPPGSVRKR